MQKLVAVLFSFGVLLSGEGLAQSAYPSKLIRIVVPFPAGSGLDNSARFIAQKMAQQTGQSVIVENSAGANGFIAAQTVARAAPDGHTVFVTAATTHALNPHLFKKLPYDPIKDFAPVTRISAQPMLFVARGNDERIKSVADLTARAKQAPGKLAFASGNASSRLAGEFYKQIGGVDLLHVPYKGVPQGLTDLLAGHVDVMFPDMATAVPQIRSGALRALAVTGAKRVPTLPDVPTMIESGLPGFDLLIWTAAYVPAKTPRPVIDRLNELIRGALTSSEAAEFFGRTGNTPTPSTPDELDAFTRSELEKWGRAVRAAGIDAE
jgi:tripartite-type tricarboxylate transporter receptor subunit TctC